MSRAFASRAALRALLGIGVAGLALAGYAAVQIAGAAGTRFHGTVYPVVEPAPAFILTDHRGSTMALADHRGRAVLLFFGFTRCPDVCPLTLAKLTRVLREAGIRPDRISVLLVTVDPEHDTPERLAEYVGRFGDVVTGLTGDPETLATIFAAYGVYAEPAHTHDGRETIAHTSLLFGIDRAGQLRALIHGDDPDDMLASDIRTLLRLRG